MTSNCEHCNQLYCNFGEILKSKQSYVQSGYFSPLEYPVDHHFPQKHFRTKESRFLQILELGMHYPAFFL